jgi:hypothetical protein
VHAGGALKLPAVAPIAGSMGDLLALAGYAILGLVAVAMLVAGWELLLQQAATARLRAAVDTDWFVAAPGTAAAPAPSMPHADAAEPTVRSAAPGTAEAAAATIAPAPAVRPGSGPVAERARDAARARDTSQPA